MDEERKEELKTEEESTEAAKETEVRETESQPVEAEAVESKGEERKRIKQEKRAAKEQSRQEKTAAKEQSRQEKTAAKEQSRQEKRAAKEQSRQEKQSARATAREERRREARGIWKITEFVMLAAFIVLAIDQAGLYGFLFVWLFLALAAASVVLFLWGIVRGIRRKRCGMVFFVAIVGILGCMAWFFYLVSSRGLGMPLR